MAKSEESGRILSRWSAAVQQARFALAAGVLHIERPKGSPIGVNPADYLSADELTAVSIVDWLASLFSDGRRPTEHETKIIRGMLESMRPTAMDERIALVETIVERHAESYRPAKDLDELNEYGQPATPIGSKRRVIADLIYELVGTVDAKFGVLFGRVDEVGAALSRYKRGREGKLSAAGLTVKLSELANVTISQWKHATVGGVGAARRRAKKKR